jgi:hypothetical protein
VRRDSVTLVPLHGDEFVLPLTVDNCQLVLWAIQ